MEKDRFYFAKHRKHKYKSEIL